ncbi:MAG: AAA family ATPase [Methanobrevibacter sp. CfCl-M3]
MGEDNNEKLSKHDDLKMICVGTQTFEFLRENNYLYVDKTKEIRDLIHNEKIVFLSRPRRFGKSLLVSTLEELFKGNKELFKGLYIYDKWDWNKKYNVISLDMSDMDNRSTEKLEIDLNNTIETIAKTNKIKLNKEISIRKKFSNLIKELYDSNSKEVIVLVDEYDAPILDNIDNKELADTNRKMLQSFYQTLKNKDEFLKFVFITGISKFIHTSIFSKLNNPTDITLLDNYSTICGITHKELDEYCNEHIHLFADKNNMSYDEALSMINYWYDGYSFDGEKKVFNPFSTLSALKNGKLSKYWFSTGTPHFLVNILRDKRVDIDFENMELSEGDLNEIDPMKIKDVPLLFQGGYLTIDRTFLNENNETEYFLRIPNFEVKQAYDDNLTKIYVEKFGNKFKNFNKLIWNEVIEGNCKRLSENLRAFIVGIPYYNRISMDNKEKWKVYPLLFRVWAEEADFYLTEEKSTEDGRIDFVLENNMQDQTLIIEMKYTADQSKSMDSLINEAFKQIEDRKYWWAYTGKIKLMALAIKDIKIGNGFTTNVKCEIKDIPVVYDD